jgi:tripartite-type tricarboxylate transporter receptor subunit TctC
MTKSVTRLVLAVAALAVTSALAQGWPARPMRLIVPFPPGGPTDVIGRTAAKLLSDALAQAVLVENRPGASGVTGADALAKSAPDGYTVGITAITLATAPHLGKVPYDTFRDFAPISNLAATTPLIVVHPTFPAKTLAELISYARANPGKIAYGTPGVATVPHLAAEMLSVAAGIQMLHVPYKGTAGLSADLLAGVILVNFESSLALAGPNIRAGKLRPIAVISGKRTPLFPDIPTVAESGYPTVQAQPWFGLSGPAGLERDKVLRMNDIIVKGLKSKEVIERLAVIGAEVLPTTPEEFAAFIRAEYDRWGEVIRKAGIKVE